MKFVRIRFYYQEPLTNDHKEILKVNFEALRDNAVKAMRNHLFNRANRQFKDRLNMMGNLAEAGITYEFPNPTEADFIFPILDMVGQAVRIGGKEYHLGNLMPKKQVVKFIKNDVSKDMGIDKDTVLYEIEEYDKD